MSTEKIQNMVSWLNEQIKYANETIKESKRTCNYGRETQYEGVRDAFIRCLKKLNA